MTFFDEISFGVLALLLGGLLGLFFVLRALAMPKQFYENQQKRRELQRALRERGGERVEEIEAEEPPES